MLSSAVTQASPPVITLARATSLAVASPQLNQQIIDAFQLAGLSIQWVKMPNQRGLYEAAAGNLDGVAFRHPNAVAKLTTLIPIPVPIKTLRYWVYMHEDKDCGTRQDLPQLQPVGVLGLIYSSIVYEISEVGHQQVSTTPQALTMLLAGRADYVVAPSIAHNWMERLSGARLQACFQAPLFSLNGYTYLNEENRELLPKLTDAYRQIFGNQEIKPLQQPPTHQQQPSPHIMNTPSR